MDKAKLWTKDFVIGTSINFLLMMNYYLLVVIMTVYAIEVFEASPGGAGLASSIFVIGALVSRLFCGMLIEQIGRRKMLLCGAALNVFMTLLYFEVTDIVPLLFIRFIHGVSYGVAATAVATIVSDLVPVDRRGEGIGYYMLSITLASAIGPFLAMYLLQHGSFSLVFAICTGLAILCCLQVMLLRVPVIKLSAEDVSAMKKIRLENFIEIKAVPISIVCSMVYFCYSGVLAFLSPYAKEINLTGAASFFFIVYSAAIFFSRPFTGRLFDRKGENVAIYPALLIFIFGLVLISQAHHGVTLMFSAVLLGFGVGVVQSCGMAIAVKVTPQHRLGLANSTFYMFLDAGVGFGPVVLGMFIPFSGYRGMYMDMVVVVLICTFIYYLLHGKKCSRERKHAAKAAECLS
ncbi:major facilitator superfamily MFS_1 [Denitrovibrio acetiphilus DSM 12809]|uniref:Major facilitator superfamily MFS_1 n=1 Tax=Denitrovibrio acetiphilus (strain DSM 12809 / NBRC 114555 / N2460) TaxID=522772 RepID=D4H536_DENA2|nr:MFS transporter [Denitrovibrio acetiphilus]ADD69392.1 major facilitator superfamily MFS_1 [Denitrovibrio acetiphilus DSM 12809]